MDTHILKTCKVLIIRVWDSLARKSAVEDQAPRVPHSRARTTANRRRQCFRRRKEARGEYHEPHRHLHRVDASVVMRVDDEERAGECEANRRTRAPLDEDEADRRRARRRDRSRNRMERARWVGIRAPDRRPARRTARVGSLVAVVAGLTS